MKISCSNCGQHMEVSDELIGQMVQCPGCFMQVAIRPPAAPAAKPERESDRIEAAADTITRIARWCVIAGLLSLIALFTGGSGMLWLAGGMFGLALILCFLAQLFHIRALLHLRAERDK